MAKKEGQKVKGGKKCGRNKRKAARFGGPLSLFVRNKISAKEYFALTNQMSKHV